MTVLIASDLDRTLIYSAGAVREHAGSTAAGELVCVEHYSGQPASFVTTPAAVLLAGLTDLLVPVTTRTPEQLARVRLPGRRARFAIAANGGFIIADGQIDTSWSGTVAAALAAVAGLDEVWLYLNTHCDPVWAPRLRQASGLFCYAVVERALLPAGFVPELTGWAAARGWRTSLQGRKLYLVPEPLTKAAAVTEVARRLGADTVLAAGDSLLDIDLLQVADRGMHPGHGELAESGWTAPHVCRAPASGVLAGEQICQWFTDETAAALAR